MKVVEEIKEEIMELEGIKNTIAERKYVRFGNKIQHSEGYTSLMDYSKRGDLENLEKVTDEMSILKEKIVQMNNNLSIELETFEKDRLEKFRKILGWKYYAEKKKAEVISEFTKIESKKFPYKDNSTLKLRKNESDSDN